MPKNFQSCESKMERMMTAWQKWAKLFKKQVPYPNWDALCFFIFNFTSNFYFCYLEPKFCHVIINYFIKAEGSARQPLLQTGPHRLLFLGANDLCSIIAHSTRCSFFFWNMYELKRVTSFWSFSSLMWLPPYHKNKNLISCVSFFSKYFDSLPIYLTSFRNFPSLLELPFVACTPSLSNILTWSLDVMNLFCTSSITCKLFYIISFAFKKFFRYWGMGLVDRLLL